MQNVGILLQIWLYEIIVGMLLMCQNTKMRVYGAYIKTYFALCPKTYCSLEMWHNQPLVRDKPLGETASVKLVYASIANMTCAYSSLRYVEVVKPMVAWNYFPSVGASKWNV